VNAKPAAFRDLGLDLTVLVSFVRNISFSCLAILELLAQFRICIQRFGPVTRSIRTFIKQDHFAQNLVHVELRCHRLHLPILVLQCLLVDLKLLGNLRARLARKNVLIIKYLHRNLKVIAKILYLELNVVLFFLLNKQLLFNNFFSFLYQALLEGLHFLNQLIGAWITAFDIINMVKNMTFEIETNLPSSFLQR
jgi:hypothetical protein